MNVNNLIAELKDPHLRFFPLCYQKFIYSQQLSLYSVINKEGVQIIKIFDDEIDSNNVDCEVTHIDGRSSMEVIKEFADTTTVSRDAGARFNFALSLVFHSLHSERSTSQEILNGIFSCICK